MREAGRGLVDVSVVVPREEGLLEGVKTAEVGSAAGVMEVVEKVGVA